MLIFLGVVFFIRALAPMRSLISELPQGSLRRRWRDLSLLILIFIVAYSLIGYALWLENELTMVSLLISILLLCGGIFAYLVGKLALQTAHDVRQLMLIKDENITDALTGIKNRRYFDQKVAEEVALSQRYKLPLSVIFIDLDYFKRVNDVYGHKVGDEVLINIASVIMETARDTDTVARYGGEEIVIITPNTAKSDAELLAQRLRYAIEKAVAAVIPATKEVVQVTASMGICSMSSMITNKEALIEEADKALYIAKKQGRNRVVCSKW